jgi:hypothetical protein
MLFFVFHIVQRHERAGAHFANFFFNDLVHLKRVLIVFKILLKELHCFQSILRTLYIFSTGFSTISIQINRATQEKFSPAINRNMKPANHSSVTMYTLCRMYDWPTIPNSVVMPIARSARPTYDRVCTIIPLIIGVGVKDIGGVFLHAYLLRFNIVCH